MAVLNIQINQRNDTNTGWDEINPFTIANNVKLSNGTTVEASLAAVTKIKTGITILSTGWIDNTATTGYWTYDHSDADITSATVVDVNIRIEDLDKAEALKPANLSSNGSVRLYALSKPSSNIIADIKIDKAVV